VIALADDSNNNEWSDLPNLDIADIAVPAASSKLYCCFAPGV
jgi:hypothetical protein